MRIFPAGFRIGRKKLWKWRNGTRGPFSPGPAERNGPGWRDTTARRPAILAGARATIMLTSERNSRPWTSTRPSIPTTRVAWPARRTSWNMRSASSWTPARSRATCRLATGRSNSITAVKKGTAIDQLTLLWALRTCRRLNVGPESWQALADRVYLPVKFDETQKKDVIAKYQGDDGNFPGGDYYGMSWSQICTRAYDPFSTFGASDLQFVVRLEGRDRLARLHVFQGLCRVPRRPDGTRPGSGQPVDLEPEARPD